MRHYIYIILICFGHFINLNAQDYTFNLIDQTFQIPDINRFQFEEGDTIMSGKTIFIKREKLDKFTPKGWAIPSWEDFKIFIKNLDGEENSTGGKEVTATYLSNILPFKLKGIYYSSVKNVFGINSMTAYYSSTDTLRSNNSNPPKLSQIALHIYSGRNGSLNVEPTYAIIENGLIYCDVIFIKKQ